jgi:heptosyltransferase-1
MRVLIVRTGAMGDVLHALPAVAALRAMQPEAQIDWVVDPRWQALLADSAGRGLIVNRVHLADTRLWTRSPYSPATLRSILALRRDLRAPRYELAVDLQGTLRSAILGRFTRAPLRTGFATPRELLATSFYTQQIARRGTHIVEQNAALLSAATGVALQPAAFSIPTEGWADNWAGELVGGRRVCLLAPSAGWPAKQWPVQHFGELAKALRERGCHVLVNSTRVGDVLGKAVADASDGAAEVTVCNVAGLIALIRRSALVIGGDSGPVHLAAALGVPVVALFGPTDPARNGPWGSGPIRILRDPASRTRYKRSSEPDGGLTRITPAEVLAALDGLL